ncbi:galactokinase [Fusobacterium sp.]|uniref:galactokinase n=1 Tax=Fusobacterium sp. TaxID=68766 RepID=UPI002638AFFC|nr:galactokinase [Fusobacterium sp.]
MEMQVVAKFNEIFGENGKKEIFFTPGRVNLIGEHIDYNGGYVFPCALSFGTYAVCRRREDNVFRMYSMNFENDGVIEFSSEKLIKANVWADYCKGVIDTFINHGYKIEKGADIVFFGNIPNGAGLSSSASLEVLMGTILREISGLNDKVSMIDIVKFGQEAENKFIGVSCGIMDQFAVGMGKEDRAILLNCDTLEYDYVPVKLDGISIVIMNTNKRRGLADSKYNERRASCEAALKDIQDSGKKINYLCDMTMEDFEEVKKYIKSDEALPRVRHAVSENVRVLDSVKNLKENNIEAFGKLMNASHVSLRDDYEVTGKELDAIVAAAWEEEGTVGARMTGAGFGGCAVSLVKNECIDEFIKNVGEKYYKATGLKADFYVANVGDGSRKIGEC